MKRAYNYFFGSAPAQQPLSPVTTAENAKAPQQDGKTASRDAGVDTPPDTPAGEAHPSTVRTVPEEDESAEPAGTWSSPPKAAYPTCLHLANMSL
jgi:hypothetical protein